MQLTVTRSESGAARMRDYAEIMSVGTEVAPGLDDDHLQSPASGAKSGNEA